jgi:hypothetical protein
MTTLIGTRYPLPMALSRRFRDWPSAVRLGVAPLVLLLLTAAHAGAQPAPGYAKEGLYVGIAGMWDFTLDGETFDGLTLYEAEDTAELFILPKLDEQDLRRIVVGFRSTFAALEFSYDRTRHDGTFADLEGEAIVNAINVDLRAFAMHTGRFQPHGVIGLNFPWLTVEDGSVLDPEVEDARFRGQGLNLEAGVTGFLTPRVGVSAGYVYRIFWFNRVRGVGDEPYRLDPRFRETTSGPVVMAFVTF